ncbi:uncharacterized protein EAE97_002759 [Botrytis byssoidea]|uniref:Uncharacterized protein n=1 Tax=Botrytis byssoidea TaxID=139641 RepID=A0A9P5IUI0_9HELO|nr:uncharacterized protein EAE97_002759 [Botrytis byssoidea]KAF7951208.1 hypothetical protein EAE97_002759 [Botrytis byssoidea]
MTARSLSKSLLMRFKLQSQPSQQSLDTEMRWSEKQRELIPRLVLEDAVCIMRSHSEERRDVADSYTEDVREVDMSILGEYSVYDEIDFGSSEYGLDRCFSFKQDLLKLGEKEEAD